MNPNKNAEKFIQIQMWGKLGQKQMTPLSCISAATKKGHMNIDSLVHYWNIPKGDIQMTLPLRKNRTEVSFL